MKNPNKTTLRNIKVLIGNAAIILAAATMTTQLNAQVTVTKKGNLKVGELVHISNSTKLGPGFSVEKGGSLTIKTHDYE